MTKKGSIMRNGSTLFLRVALVGLVILASIVAGAILWSAYTNWSPQSSQDLWLSWPLIGGILVATLGFYVAALQAWKLLGYADKGKPFSKDSIKALRTAKFAALTVGAALLAEMPLIYSAAQEEDAPGLIIFGFAFAMVPIVVGVFAGVLQQLIQKALDLKSENDLTV